LIDIGKPLHLPDLKPLLLLVVLNLDDVRNPVLANIDDTFAVVQEGRASGAQV